ncbi:MAG: ComF family protein, partial [Gemmatimonadota bacterium]|nr:ComF family protein [Gemmatimonadota bacterium]
LHPLRRRERGYNQSACIARGISDVTGIPVLEDVLGRNRNTPTQTSLSPEARMANVEGVFELARSDAVGGATVSLVDDIFTTGATINSCARALLQAGAGRVFALTVARA